MSNFSNQTKKSLRKTLRLQRVALSPSERRKKSQHLAKILGNRKEFLHSHRIAAYCPTVGEISPEPLLTRAYQSRKKCYLPVLHPLKAQELLFVEYKPGDPLILNRYGIYEPVLKMEKCIPPWLLNLVLVPLLGFDFQGHRLGKGKGYYDHTFAFLKTKVKPLNPVFIGLAFEVQRQENLPVDPWDIDLSYVATESRFITVYVNSNTHT